MGAGEETRRAVEFVRALKARWDFARDSFNGIVEMHTSLTDGMEKFVRHDPASDRMLSEKLARILPNQDERIRLFGMLTPIAPKPPTVATSQRAPSSEVDNLLPAPNTIQEPVVAGGSERWMAVNTPVTAQTTLHIAPPKSDEGGSLDALAGFAAQQGKIGNGREEYGSRDVEMGEAGVKKEEIQGQGEDRRWGDNGVQPGWGPVGTLEG